MSTFVRIHSMKYVQVMMMIQENEPGTVTFMEDSARDDGTVILAEVSWPSFMIYKLRYISNIGPFVLSVK